MTAYVRLQPAFTALSVATLTQAGKDSISGFPDRILEDTYDPDHSLVLVTTDGVNLVLADMFGLAEFEAPVPALAEMDSD